MYYFSDADIIFCRYLLLLHKLCNEKSGCKERNQESSLTSVQTDRIFSDVTIIYYEGRKTRKQNNIFASLILKSVQTDKILSNMLKRCVR